MGPNPDEMAPYGEEAPPRSAAGKTPLKREGNRKGMTDLAMFLVSPGAVFITGANLDINGGTIFS